MNTGANGSFRTKTAKTALIPGSAQNAVVVVAHGRPLAMARRSKQPQRATPALDRAAKPPFEQYLDWIASAQLSPRHGEHAPRFCIGYFLDWCRERGSAESHRDHAAHPGTLSALRSSLPQEQRPAARLPHAARRAWRALKGFFQWLARQNLPAAQSGLRTGAAAAGEPLAQSTC